MQIAILGPLEVRDANGTPLEVAGARLRTLLARLAIDAGKPVPVGVLVDCVWGGQPPAEATNALQTLVSRLRRALGEPGALVQSSAGYRLAVPPEAVDTHRFGLLVAEGTRARADEVWDGAARCFTDALALWRGPALADVGDACDTLATEADRLTDLHVTALVGRAESELHRGAPSAPLIPDLEALQHRFPLDERIAAQLVRALGHSGRQADALDAYEQVRVRLADELGVDPSAELQEVYLAVLRGELVDARPAPRRTNLKARLTSFVGRETEVTRIVKSLEQHRLVTLAGPGGAGKTRLAGEAAAHVLDAAPDGVWLVELAPVTSGGDVPQAVLTALGMREMHLLDRTKTLATGDALTRLLDGLAERRMVIVLDNCEHLIDACARLADELLAGCPGLRILATSREPLGIFGEVLLAVPSLGQPSGAATPAEALEFPAVRLFADRAATVLPDFEIDHDSVAPVIEIVRRLDGLPLAIELAAARLRTMPLDDIAARLSDRFRLLTGGSRTALARHRTLRAVVEWSWDLMTPTERLVAEELSVFPAGVTVSSAAAVCTVEDVEDVLASLIDKSLLQPVDGGRRLRMLETIREFGAERLAEREAFGPARARHAEHFAAVLAEAVPHLTTAGQVSWFALLEQERENIVAALRYRCDVGDADGALWIATNLSGYAMMLGFNSDVVGWLTDALAVPGRTDDAVSVTAETVLALSFVIGGGNDRPPADARESLRELTARLSEVRRPISPMFAYLRPAAAFLTEQRELAETFLAESLADPDPWARASARLLRASMAENDGDVSILRRDAELAAAEFEAIGERWGISNAQRLLAQILVFDSDLDGAVAAYERALALTTELNSHDDEGFLLGKLADLEARRGNLDVARRYVDRARGRADESGAPVEELFAASIEALIDYQQGDLDAARRHIDETALELAAMPADHPARDHMEAIVLSAKLRFEIADGHLEAATDLGRKAYAAGVQTKDGPMLASVGVALAELAIAARDDTRAASLLGAAARLRGAEDPTAIDVRDATRLLRERLGTNAFERAYASGAGLDRDAALALLAVPD